MPIQVATTGGTIVVVAAFVTSEFPVATAALAVGILVARFLNSNLVVAKAITLAATRATVAVCVAVSALEGPVAIATITVGVFVATFARIQLVVALSIALATPGRAILITRARSAPPQGRNLAKRTKQQHTGKGSARKLHDLKVVMSSNEKVSLFYEDWERGLTVGEAM
jgi:ABC-type transport system involved in multi-copper enzyme maturation permease subunit